jgi:hypothetical protein
MGSHMGGSTKNNKDEIEFSISYKHIHLDEWKFIKKKRRINNQNQMLACR